MRLIIVALLLSGCAASLQPFPYKDTFTKDEVVSAFGQRDQLLKVIADAVKKLNEKVFPEETAKAQGKK